MRRTRLFAALSAALVAASSVVAVAVTSTPATAGPPSSPVVTAEPMPTWQTNGNVWAVEHVGGVVYVGGNFTSVRPPGAAPGTGEVARKNLAAFDAKTGALLPFSHNFTSDTFSYAVGTNPDVTCTVNWTARTYTCDTVYEIRKSPDGTKIYVGGDFMRVDGATRMRLAAFSTANHKTVNNPLDPAFVVANTNQRVRSLAVTNDTLYAGGLFTSSGNQPRSRLAAYNRLTGALRPWAPTADGLVLAMTMSPDNSRVILGGEFNTINGTSIHGLASVFSTDTGATAPWSSRPIPGASYVTDLVTDQDTVYASSNGEGTFDGRLAADPNTGALRWIDNCLGATWSLALMGDVLYSGSHAHNCSNTDGGFPEMAAGKPNPRWFRLLAQSARSTQTTIQHWFPSTNGGDPSLPASQTPSRLGPRTMTTDGEYLWVGGQFTTVNGVAQQGITRFTYRPTSPGRKPVRPAEVRLASVTAGEAQVSWTGVEDLDSQTLTYELFRGTTLIHSVTRDSKPWLLPSMSFRDTGLTPGQTYSYQVRAKDPDGNLSTKSYPVSVTITNQTAPYPSAVLSDSPNLYWRLSDTTGPNITDLVGQGGTYGSGVAFNQAGGVASAPADNAIATNGATSGRSFSRQLQAGPHQFSIELFAKTTTTSGGKLIGFGNSANGTSSQYDRHIYLNNSGQLVFGVYPGGVRTIKSASTYRDGQWHHIVATLGADGMKLYVDGGLVASNASVTSAENYTGYWRIGGDNLNGWPDRGSSDNVAATIDDVSVYPTTLTAAQVSAHLAAARP